MPKVKLPRTQGRWSYKTTPKPRITIRKQSDDDERVSTVETPITSESTITTITDEKSLSSPPAQKKIQEGGTYDDELDPSETEEVSSTSVQSDQAQPEPHLPLETLNVEISTAADFNDVYFEIATIKSPYAFQVYKSQAISLEIINNLNLVILYCIQPEVIPHSLSTFSPFLL